MTPRRAKDEPSVREEVVQAAIAWWEAKRPDEYDEEEHLTDPTAYCDGASERRLAEKVATLVSTLRISKERR